MRGASGRPEPLEGHAKYEKCAHPPHARAASCLHAACSHRAVQLSASAVAVRCCMRRVKDLNSGTFGFVQLCKDKTTNELVAIKFIERGDKVRWGSAIGGWAGGKARAAGRAGGPPCNRAAPPFLRLAGYQVRGA